MSVRQTLPPASPPASPPALPGPALPIDPVLPELAQMLAARGAVVLQAPPGAGKTTRVPLYLHLAGAIEGRIVMLEPRRVAARAAAERLAETLGGQVGGLVGFRMRGDSRVGPDTRIEVVTEGVLTRMIQSDPELSGVGCVIFDEFHERSLNADLGLALVLESRTVFRPDLRLVVMSATLDAGPVAALIDAPVLTAQGVSWPVETRWAARPGSAPWQASAPPVHLAMAAQVRRALDETAGGVLAFLPGEGEIRRTMAALLPHLPPGVEMMALYGALPIQQQRQVLGPCAGRRLVLATAIAETSLTIPDIAVVIDSGLARRARFDPGSGMSRLVTERVTRAEADQRRGRAGRTGPGLCYRLWAQAEDGALHAHPPPEIAAADLTALALDLAQWGAVQAADMPFLTQPPEAALAGARAVLRALGALDDAGGLTAHGRALSAVPAHPRLAHMLRAGGGALAADLAALMQGRDAAPGAGTDIALRLRTLRHERADGTDSARQTGAIRAEAARLRRHAGPDRGLSPGALLSLAFPDRIGQHRGGEAPRYLLSGGRGAILPPDDPLTGQPWLVAAELDGAGREARIRQAAPLTRAEIDDLHGARAAWANICAWSRREGRVIARQELRMGALVLNSRPWTEADPEALVAAMIGGIREMGIESLPWTRATRLLAARVQWARSAGADLPDFSPDGLLDDLPGWAAPWLTGLRSRADLDRFALAEALSARLGHSGRTKLDRLAPERISAPTGTGLAIDYGGPQPRVSVRVQEMFGTTAHPLVGPARQPLLIELLSPAGRPIALTSDLPGFWAGAWADVLRDMRGRYPHHPWPDDPASAPATARAKPRAR